MIEPAAKEQALCDALASLDSVVVAYSGGVDSAYLAYIASRTLGDRAVAVTADSPSYPERHRALAIRIAKDFGLRHEIIKTSELEQPEYRANPANRCYFCKHELYTHLSRIAIERRAVVVDGNNADDRGDYRPGRQAAREFGVRSPLDEVDLTKDEIRELSHRAGLPTWDEPASACLSSRIPYHTEVTDEKLRTIERAEQAVRALGFRVFRVRHHDDLARVEIARDEMPRALEPEIAAAIVRELKAAGYRYVTLDLQGYRLGSLNEGLHPAADVSRLRSLQGRDPACQPARRPTTDPSSARHSGTLGCCTPRDLFLALHLPYLPKSLEDLDSINFALGVRHFDVAHHQPHPPGYPVFIVIAKALHAVVPAEATALALVSVIAAALGVLGLASLFRRLDEDDVPARWSAAAVAVAMTSPLYWFTAVRPISDSSGLAAAIGVQAMTLAASTARGLVPGRDSAPASPRACGRRSRG